MFKKIFAVLLTGVLLSSFVACGSSDSDSNTSSNTVSDSNNTTITDNTENNSENGTPAADNKVNKYKIYELKRADNDKITIELWYRTGSDYVAQVSGAIYVPTGSSEYDNTLADNIAFDEDVKAAGISEDLMHFRYDEVKLENGYVRCDFSFKELDDQNSDSVAMIAAFLGLPASNGSFKLAECEEYLQQNDLLLTSEH